MLNHQVYNYHAQKEGKPLLQWSSNITFSVKTDNPAYIKIHEVWAISKDAAAFKAERLLDQLIKQKAISKYWDITTAKAECVNEYAFNDQGQNEFEVVFNAKKVRHTRRISRQSYRVK